MTLTRFTTENSQKCISNAFLSLPRFPFHLACNRIHLPPPQTNTNAWDFKNQIEGRGETTKKQTKQSVYVLWICCHFSTHYSPLWTTAQEFK